MFDVLYGFFIKPIELVVEIVFSLMFRIFNNAGIAIVFVSIVIQLLVLPMYKRADALQDEERRKQKEMKPWVDHIKKTFKGDERFMMLSAYYREVGYSQASSLKSSLSLLLQIPFFIAAYNYLSNLAALKGASFLGIADLSKPDGLIMVGGLTINLLPILMTVFNIISGIIYTKGFPIRDKVQTYGLAAVFLVVLYNCPAGLVLYWTLNNLFSLGKNVVMKVLPAKSEPMGTGLLAHFHKNDPTTPSPLGHPLSLFLLSTVVMTVLMGFIIPLSVVSTSPTEFVSTNYSPLGLVLRTGAVYAGIFLLWMRIFFYLASDRGKRIMTFGMSMLTVIAIADFYLFGRDYGTMSVFLQYDQEFMNSSGLKILSIVLFFAIAGAVFILLKKKPVVMKRIFQACLLSGVILVLNDGIGVAAKAPIFKTAYVDVQYEKILPLSKSGKNVVVLMLDRAIGALVPYLFDEKPELAKMYDGFTFYPNTLSYGTTTNFATPALFGGYEYTPLKVNERARESLKDKQNEALSVMPRIFLENDYKVVITDPPYAGYKYSPDISVFDKYKNEKKGLDAYVLGGKYAGETARVFAPSFEKKQQRNFIFYSLMRAAPAALQGKLYDHGDYFLNEDFSENTPASQLFLDSYTTLEALPKITDIKDDDSNNFLMMQNETTHENVVLSKPDYVPSVIAESQVYENNHVVNGRLCDIHEEMQQSHYDVNMAALLKVGAWLDYLKEQGVYDNTRIIIVSDHGRQLVNFKDMIVDDGVHQWIDIESYNPLFMVKDFGAKGFKTSDEFMTNADTATLATAGVIKEPKNPFSGKMISNEDKNAKYQIITTSWNFEIDKGNGYTFETDDGNWYQVGKKMLDPRSWKCLGKNP